MKINRKSFFDGYREAFGRLSQQQVDGLEFLLTAIEKDEGWESIPQVSYFLATIHHETAHTFQPIKEIRERADSPRRANQDRYWLTGFYGRGYIQITWRANYEKFGIADNPDKALEPETAYEIASRGMREGVFTGKKIGDFINEGRTDYINARRVVNGLDRAQLIAGNAKSFEAILLGEDVTETEKEPEPAKPEPKPPVTTVPTNPPVVEVKSAGTSLTTKIGAAAGPIGTIATALGIKVGGIQITQSTVHALCAVAIVALICSTVIYITGKNREQERLKMSVNNLADPNRQNVVAGGQV